MIGKLKKISDIHAWGVIILIWMTAMTIVIFWTSKPTQHIKIEYTPNGVVENAPPNGYRLWV